MKKLFLVLFSVFLISCSTDIPEEEGKGDIKEPLTSYNEWLNEMKNIQPGPANPPVYGYSPPGDSGAAIITTNGVLQEVIYCEGSGRYCTTKK